MHPAVRNVPGGGAWHDVGMSSGGDDVRLTPAVQLVGLVKTFGDVRRGRRASTSRSTRASSSRCSDRRASGKTTVLRMIAGFELPTAGAILLQGQDVTTLAAVRPRRQHRVPGLRPVPAHDGAAERRVRPQGQGRRPVRAPPAGGRDARDRCACRQYGARKPNQLSRRPAPARRARPGARQPARRCCCSTSRSARSTSSCARRCRSSCKTHPARGGHHVRVRHPRPGRGAVDEQSQSPCSTTAGSSRSARPARSTSTPQTIVRGDVRRHRRTCSRRRVVTAPARRRRRPLRAPGADPRRR